MQGAALSRKGHPADRYANGLGLSAVSDWAAVGDGWIWVGHDRPAKGVIEDRNSYGAYACERVPYHAVACQRAGKRTSLIFIKRPLGEAASV